MIPVHNAVQVKPKKEVIIASLVAFNPHGGFVCNHIFEPPLILQVGDSASIQWNLKIDSIE